MELGSTSSRKLSYVCLRVGWKLCSIAISSASSADNWFAMVDWGLTWSFGASIRGGRPGVRDGAARGVCAAFSGSARLGVRGEAGCAVFSAFQARIFASGVGTGVTKTLRSLSLLAGRVYERSCSDKQRRARDLRDDVAAPRLS